MGIHFVFLSVLLSPLMIFGQTGCTDPQALNYNPNAQINDGSCIYPASNYSLNLIGTLGDEVQENSGLVRIGNFIYTFNDSGSGPFLYEMDTNGLYLRTIVVGGATNVDWEAITTNTNHVFIGDFGNNLGNRQDLCIYRIPKNTLIQDTVQAEKMEFYWSDQTQFTAQSNAHNYDCEAFFSREDSLILFSKNWIDLNTRRYSLPVFWTDTIPAMLMDSFNVDGLITDACIDVNLNEAFLLGYKNNGNNFYTSFIWCLWDYNSNKYFNGNKRRIEIGNVLNVSQTEGIGLFAPNKGYVSAEKVVSVITLPPKLFAFDLNNYLAPLAEIPAVNGHKPMTISIIPGNDFNEIIIDEDPYYCSLTDIQGRRINFQQTEKGIKTNHHGSILLTIGRRTQLLWLP